MSCQEYPYFIINEYEILKRIFSNLSNKDLVASSRVCREWRAIAQKMIAESARPCCFLKDSKYWSQPVNKDLKLQPKLIIHMTSQLSKVYSSKTFIQLFSDVDLFLRKNYNLDDVSILSLQNWKYITTSTDKNGVLKIIHDDDEDPRECVFVLPEFGDLKVNMNCLAGTTDYPAAFNAMKKAKCCIVLTGPKKSHFDIIDSFLKTFVQSEELSLVGGIAQKIYCKSGMFLPAIPVVIISFSGESLSAFVDILDDSKNMETFFPQMAENLGPTPDGYMRIAFIFSCVNRYQVYKELETSEFSKYFPDVPIYGFWSLGEFYYKGPILKRKHSECGKKSQQKPLSRNQFFHQEVTSYLIITFKK